MQIHEVTIHGFRGINDASFKMMDYGLLVGSNNSGKSTAIAAILCFYEKDGFKFSAERDIPKLNNDGETWVEIEFALTSDEKESLKEEYQRHDNRIRLRKSFVKSSKTEKAPAIFVVNFDGEISESSFYGAKNVQSGKIGDIVYVPAVSSVDEHTKLSGPSALRDLLTSVISDVVVNSTEYAHLKSEFEDFSCKAGALQTDDGRSIDGLEAEINQSLSNWGVKFAVNMDPPDHNALLKNLTRHTFTDKCFDGDLDSSVFGSGFQRHMIYTLIKLKTQYKAPTKTAKTKDFTPSMTVLLFEEPEAFLHPPQQSVMAGHLRSLSAEEGFQVLCSTHSSHFVAKSCHELQSIVRARRWDDGCIKLYQIDNESWKQIFDTNQQITTIAKKYKKLEKSLTTDDTKIEMEALRYSLWLNPDRASMFFADVVLIVEGATEVAIINRLIDENKIATARAECGVYVLDAMGKYNMHRYMSLLSAMGIDHAVLYDDDNNNNEHADLNQLIQDSKCPDHTINATSVRGDIETVLKVQPTARHRKPQNVMFAYDSGGIAKTDLDVFCGIVNGCISPPAA